MSNDRASARALAALRGPSRQAHWRRRRLRRLAALALAAFALVLLAGRLAPHPPATDRVFVAARDIPSGARLRPGDLREVRWPATAPLPGRIDATGDAVGRRALGPIAAGEPLSHSRIVADRALPPGTRAVAVPVADPATVALARPGDRIEVYAPATDRPVASGLRVLTAAAEDTGPGAAGPSGVIVVAPASVAGRLAQAIGQARAQGDTLSIALLAAAG